jgi:histone H3/H4
MNHRDAWCEEARAPREEPAEPMQTVRAGAAAPPAGRTAERRIVPSAAVEAAPDDVLIVASRLKQYITEKADMNTSADVLEALSDIVRAHTDQAIRRARMEGRKTVKGRDFQG